MRLLTFVCVVSTASFGQTKASVGANLLQGDGFAKVVKAAAPSVVSLSSTSAQGKLRQASGFFFDSAGHILTNAHVVVGIKAVTVKLFDGRTCAALVLAVDEVNDVAVIQSQIAGPAAVAEPSSAEVGDWALAIGNPFGLGLTATNGIISALSRAVRPNAEPYIQTTAALNPGSSGGPLFNIYGKLVGMTTAVVSNGQGISFAVPIDAALRIAQNLILNKRFVPGWLGVEADDDVAKGVYSAVVNHVYEGSPASSAEIQVGDRIEQLNGVRLQNRSHFVRLLRQFGAQARITLSGNRSGKDFEVNATLVARP